MWEAAIGSRLGRRLTAAAFVLVLGACAPHEIYRPDMALCSSPAPELNCLESALQEYSDPGKPDATYMLGFVEFDDQGQLWSRKQMRTVIDAVNTQARDERDVIIIVFAHGWKHSAAPGDDNIGQFRKILKRISRLESGTAAKSATPARQVMGVYLGWRGGSITAPVLKQLTFWDRKATAQKVGRGAVTEVLTRLELVKQTKGAESNTRLVVVGHSFGGALVYTAIGQLLADRFVQTLGAGAGVVTDARGFGDLVVLINPAFEANLYAPLSDMTTERRTYFKAQRPVLAVLTSEADDATKRAFPIGRWFSTIFEIEREVTRPNAVSGEDETIDQGDGNITAVGHFKPYRTHYLGPADLPKDSTPPALQEDLPEDRSVLTIQEELMLFNSVREAWEKDAPGHVIEFRGSTLERTTNSVGRNPYLVVQVNEGLIPDHNDIYDERISTFLRQLIFMSVE